MPAPFDGAVPAVLAAMTVALLVRPSLARPGQARSGTGEARTNARGSSLRSGPAVAVVRALVRGWRTRGQQRRRRQMVIELCDGLVAELRAGLPAQAVVANACGPWPELAPVVATARLGGDLPAALRRASRAPGAAGLRLVAASWEVSGRSGAGLASVLERVGVALRDDEEAHSEVASALGPPRATAKMLAVLPLFGLGLGASTGANPVRFLVGTTLGVGCLVAGLVLAAAGLWWVERLAAAVEE